MSQWLEWVSIVLVVKTFLWQNLPFMFLTQNRLNFVHSSLVQSTTQNSPDISRRNAITRAVMQKLDNQIWKSRIAISTQLKLYNTCILPIFLYGSECWAVTKRNVLEIDALNQWCLRKLLGIKRYHSAECRGETDNRTTTTFGYCPTTTSFPVRPHCTNARRNRCQEDHNSFPSENWRPPGRPRTTWMKTIQ